MNGIPTTFDEDLPSYAVVQGGARRGQRGISAVITCRIEDWEKPAAPEPYEIERRRNYERLEKYRFEQILVLLPAEPYPSISEFSAAYPFIHFILPSAPLTIGRQINLAAAELKSPRFLVMPQDASLAFYSISSLAADSEPRLCSVPSYTTKSGAELAVQRVPDIKHAGAGKSIVRTKPAILAEGERCLFPFDGAGVYNRERFVQLGGYDGSILNEHWQLMDFGLRALAWGEEIAAAGNVKLLIEQSTAEIEIALGASYRRFFLKNILPVYRLDCAYLPLRRFLPFLSHSGLHPSGAWEEFAAARLWVSRNTYRWKRDIRKALEKWE